VPEGQITDADIERIKRAFELFNEGDFDALRDFMSPDVVMERVGAQPPIKGWEAFRAFQEPDAFEWQRIHPLDWTVNGDKAMVHIRMVSKGAASGVELEVDAWLVFTFRDGAVVQIENVLDEADARAAAGLGQNDSP
jgi:ketosteroid isomerase-like protein